MKAILVIVSLIFCSSPTYSEQAEVKVGRSKVWLVTGTGQVNEKLKIRVRRPHPYEAEIIIDKPVYKIVSLSKNGKILETRFFDLNTNPLMGANAGPEKETVGDDDRLFRIYMKDLPGIDRIRLSKSGKLESEINVPTDKVK